MANFRPMNVKKARMDSRDYGHDVWIEDNVNPTHRMETPNYVRPLTEEELKEIALDADAMELEEIE